MRKVNRASQPLGVISVALAFGLSAVMCLAFVLVVDKTHDLFSSAAFEDGISPFSIWERDQNPPAHAGGTDTVLVVVHDRQ